MIVKSFNFRKILDSRGNWTIELELYNSKNIGVKSSVPSGKSTGQYEVVALEADKCFGPAQFIFNKIKNKKFKNQKDFDNFLIKLDGTKDKSRLGGNTILAFSYAALRLLALEYKLEPWQYFNFLLKEKCNPQIPRLFANMINGGLHSGNNLNFQEYLIIPKTKNIEKAIKIIVKFYHSLGEELQKIKGGTSKNLGDEGGYAPNFKNDIEPFDIMKKLAQKMKFLDKIYFGLDAAATNIKSINNTKLEKIYLNLYKKFNLFYLEDPFGEDNFDLFSKLKINLKNTYICGDDLTTTNILRMKKAKIYKSINAVIIKPNQIGTVSETIEAIEFARSQKWLIIISHRSGETNDSIIVDLAYGVGADGLKLGAPARGERVAKYNRLLEIYNNN